MSSPTDRVRVSPSLVIFIVLAALAAFLSNLSSHEKTLDREIVLVQEQIKLNAIRNAEAHARSLADRESTKRNIAVNRETLADLRHRVESLEALKVVTP